MRCEDEAKVSGCRRECRCETAANGKNSIITVHLHLGLMYRSRQCALSPWMKDTGGLHLNSRRPSTLVAMTTPPSWKTSSRRVTWWTSSTGSSPQGNLTSCSSTVTLPQSVPITPPLLVAGRSRALPTPLAGFMLCYSSPETCWHRGVSVSMCCG